MVRLYEVDSAQKGHTAAQQVKFVNSISIPLHIVPACTFILSRLSNEKNQKICDAIIYYFVLLFF